MKQTINVLPDEGPVRSETCGSLIFKNKNNFVNYITIVCICGLKVYKLG